MPQNALLINPWINDFSAYDLWMKPVGLLRVASHLRKQGFSVNFFDCLASHSRKDPFDCGKFTKKMIKKPEQVKDIPRAFYRYGVSIDQFIQYLNNIQTPDVVYVSAGMTFWYLGVQDVIKIVRQKFKNARIIIGGNYTVLCRNHALKHSGADEIWKGKKIDDYPAWDLIGKIESVVVQTSFGCPFNCRYCGTSILCDGFYQRPYLEVVEEIEYYIRNYSPKDIAFYDDALLVNSEKHIKPFLRELIKKNINVRFHTPNAIHARYVDKELAGLMKKAGFVSLALGFETSKQDRRDTKVNNEELFQAVHYFKEAGFTVNNMTIYTMCGSLDDSPEDAKQDIIFVTENVKIPVILSTYSLVPGSEDYKRWGFNEDLDPLWHNKTIFPLFNKKYSIEGIRKLRYFASGKNKELIN
jgi:radical SAM superfamily enzyme YgiQ (UPF0313 family)